MKTFSRKGGFSLVELLTVIAIIAILAAIIFPVMGAVKRRAQQNNCMANLKQIAIAVQMFKTDNRRYPDILGSPVHTTAGGVWNPNNPTADIDLFENSKDKYLFSEYVNSFTLFHCPTSKITNTRDVAVYRKSPYDQNSPLVAVYAYNSYDCFVRSMVADNEIGESKVFSSNVDVHYCTNWVPSNDMEAGVQWLANAGCPLPHAPDMPDGLATAQQDYARQLKFRNPPGDTVVTWCSYHATFGGSEVKDSALVVFLDGHCDRKPAKEVEMCKWRTRPTKG